LNFFPVGFRSGAVSMLIVFKKRGLQRCVPERRRSGARGFSIIIMIMGILELWIGDSAGGQV